MTPEDYISFMRSATGIMDSHWVNWSDSTSESAEVGDFLTTEAGEPLMTEAGDHILWEA